MNDTKLRKICSFLMVINAVAAFLLFGMPKFYKNEQNLIHKTVPAYADGYRIFIAQKDIVLKDKDGNNVAVHSGTKIVRLNEVEETVIREIDDMKDESIVPVSVRARSYEDAYIMRSDLENPAKFSEITEQVMKEQNDRLEEERKEGHKEYCLYVLKQRFWFVLFPLYPLHILVGLIGLIISLKMMKFVDRSGKLREKIAVTVLLIAVKAGAIIYFTVHPFIGYSPFQTQLPIPNLLEILRTLFG